MAKKNKRNIKALIAKRAELQALSQQTSLSIPGAPKTAPRPIDEPVLTEAPRQATLSAHHSTEIWRTLIATAIIAIALTTVVVIDHQKPFLDTFGGKLYNALQLGS